MIRRFTKNIENRKDLVKKISAITGIASRYTGMPKASYEIGNFVVEKDGTLAVTMTEDGNEGAVILALKADSMIGEEISIPQSVNDEPTINEEQHANPEQTAGSSADLLEQPVAWEHHTELVEGTAEEQPADDDEYQADDEQQEKVDGETQENCDEGTDAATSYIPVEDMDDTSYSALGLEDWEPAEPETTAITATNVETDEQQAEGLQIDEPRLIIDSMMEMEETVISDRNSRDADENKRHKEGETNDERINGIERAVYAEDTETADWYGGDDETADALEVAFPLFKHTPTSIINLVCMIHSRGPLLSKATGGHFSASKELANALLDAGNFVKVENVVKFIDDFISSARTETADTTSGKTVNDDAGDLIGLRFEDDKLIFDGFTNVPNEAHAHTFTHLASAMNKMALTQKRVQVKKVDETNEKYALRIWLVRLNINGDEYKEDRKILMENLTGHTAFRTEAEKEKWMKRQLAKKLALKEAKIRAADGSLDNGSDDE